jgi:cytochrome c-type biogenesis protein CcmH
MRRVGKLRLLAAVFLGIIALLSAGDDSARVDKLGHRMMCACGCNQILLECNHVGCTYSSRMRGELVAAVDSGESDRDVLQFFVQKYGTTILAAPTKQGFDRVAWIMPYLALIIGVGGVVLAVHSWHNRGPAPAMARSSAGGDSEIDRFRAQARKETEL